MSLSNYTLALGGLVKIDRYLVGKRFAKPLPETMRRYAFTNYNYVGAIERENNEVIYVRASKNKSQFEVSKEKFYVEEL